MTVSRALQNGPSSIKNDLDTRCYQVLHRAAAIRIQQEQSCINERRTTARGKKFVATVCTNNNALFLSKSFVLLNLNCA